MSKRKLPKAQARMIERMRDGWELGYVAGLRLEPGTYVVQRNGLGRGGEVVNVHARTVCSLLDAGLIEVDEEKTALAPFWRRHYKLTARSAKAMEGE